MAGALRDLSGGQVEQPLRLILPVAEHHGFFGVMPAFEAHLLSLPSSDDPAAPLCPTLSTKSTGGNHGLSSMFQRVMAKAGVYGDRGVKKSGKGRQFKTLGFHSLRHTFVSELANAVVPADVRRQISGHNDEKIHERYTHLDMDSKRRALTNLRPLSRDVAV